MNVLSIGNSFSHDAHKWLHALAEQNGVEIQTLNLFIGGCSLEMHWENVCNDNAFYDAEYNGNEGEEKISISQALKLREWDVVTLQQVSQLSGMADSYEPFFGNLVASVRRSCPDAKNYVHQTWAYETDSLHGGFVNYGNDQRKMFECIVSAVAHKAKDAGVGIIPAGEVIQYLRENTQEFDYSGKGLSLCRDGFHLSFDYGRYAAAATWLRVLGGKPLAEIEFRDFDFAKTSKIISAVNRLIV